MSNLKNKSLYLIPFLLFASPVLAHNVKTEGNVAATFHIEPNHNPKAGEASKAWFALTKPGGEVIPLDRCNCQLKITSNKQTIAQPTLKAISAEQYKGIPGAEVTFPQAGIYTLEISGTPKVDADEFNAFKFAYDVTVQAGAAPQSSPVAQVPTTTQPAETGWILPVTIGAIALAAGAWIMKRSVKN
ncbi:MAG: hypothetical protein KME10_14115 [Plectolyngbya sp. WJT66-NPBG17]|jgi:hypothetical protein|nr:hypothetical protein [Plectolyngbya sp. WJT66-NPBG17]MBW4526425.1 hypothetical protein [Phormidium tanganyikae FI6-MK23]